ncbi:CTP synthase [Candidatus Collierbacteria bacterium]|nr:CTP synthase [Candidatus Collierbacteria bacterium]
MKTNFIFTVGGVLSGLGKGITTASVGLILKSKGFSVTAVKIDPYVSLDAGTMRPAEHGETFVTDDGGEIDQDLGNYERFLGISLTKKHNLTTGKIFQAVINNERSFKYGGRDVEMFPDVINEIKDRIYEIAKGYDFCLVEVGGTTGDLENLPFLHAAREIGRENPTLYIMVTYLPFLRNVGELKTKPTQHAVVALRQVGISPDFIITRNETPIGQEQINTISARCFVDPVDIIDNPDIDSIARIPLRLAEARIGERILEKLKLKPKVSHLAPWEKYVAGLTNPKKRLKIALVGKYVHHGEHDHKDVYISVLEAVRHASAALGVAIDIVGVDSSEISNQPEKFLDDVVGIIVPQGWGGRGTEGIITAIKYAREHKLPYLGLCFGMQLATIEFARNVAGLKKANSEEINSKTPYPVIHLMEHQKEHLAKGHYGGTIRLGAYPCAVKPGTLLAKIYQKSKSLTISERHRHRYEFNNQFKEILTKNGLIISGTSPDGSLVEAIELPAKIHPFFLGTQFHPEYKSRPLDPHPIFIHFLRACFAKPASLL